MKKILLLSTLLLGAFTVSATVHTVSISGLTYVPNVVDAFVGDTVVFEISANHPTAQVSESDWNTNTNNLLPGGFGPFTSNFQLVLTEDMVPVVYYICTNHIGSGMKGKINVTSTINIEEHSDFPEINLGANPITNNQLTYSFGNRGFSGTFDIYSVSGKLVQSTIVNSREGVIKLGLTPGTYILTITDVNGRAIKTRRISIR